MGQKPEFCMGGPKKMREREKKEKNDVCDNLLLTERLCGYYLGLMH